MRSLPSCARPMSADVPPTSKVTRSRTPADAPTAAAPTTLAENAGGYPDFDMAAIITPRQTVPGIIDELGRRGTKAAVVLSAGFKDDADKDQVAVMELGKDIVRTTLAIVQTRSGKQIQYQDEEARKSAKD